jgi:hypothetical protein
MLKAEHKIAGRSSRLLNNYTSRIAGFSIYAQLDLQSCCTLRCTAQPQKTKHKKRGFDESPSVYFAAAYAVNFFFSRIRADLPVRSRK